MVGTRPRGDRGDRRTRGRDFADDVVGLSGDQQIAVGSKKNSVSSVGGGDVGIVAVNDRRTVVGVVDRVDVDAALKSRVVELPGKWVRVGGSRRYKSRRAKN